MTTSATIRGKWAAMFAASTTLQAYTDKFHAYDLSSILPESQAHESQARYNQAVNFVEYLIHKQRNPEGIGAQEVQFSVAVRYTVQADIAGAHYNQIEDFFESLCSEVDTRLSTTWGGVVDFYQTPDGPPDIETTEILGEPCWTGSYTFQATTTE
jgi:hypothetical protein